jgi:signal transduction histidine kinase
VNARVIASGPGAAGLVVVVGGAVVEVVVDVEVLVDAGVDVARVVEVVCSATGDELPAHPARRPSTPTRAQAPARRVARLVTVRTLRHPSRGRSDPYASAMAATAPTDRRVITDLEWGVARGIAGFRWLALGWAAIVMYLTRAQVDGPALGIVLLGAGLLVTATTTVGTVQRRHWVFSPVAVVIELAVGASMLLLDGSVYEKIHSQSVGSAWPVAGILMAALVGGPIAGAIAGVALGIARWTGAQIADWPATPGSMSLVSSGVLFAIAGGAAGAAMDLIRRAETEVAQARAREEVARTLHDGVLQTLAVVQRRSSDDELVVLAREQELELRAYLAGDRPQTEEIGAALRSTAARIERRDGMRVEVLFVDEDLPVVAPAVVDAITGAVGEALTNAHKHGHATRATVFVDIDDEVFCSIKDDGQGFDPATVTPGTGIKQSIEGRLAEVGGSAEVDARPGSGVEVRLNAPLRPKR